MLGPPKEIYIIINNNSEDGKGLKMSEFETWKMLWEANAWNPDRRKEIIDAVCERGNSETLKWFWTDSSWTPAYRRKIIDAVCERGNSETLKWFWTESSSYPTYRSKIEKALLNSKKATNGIQPVFNSSANRRQIEILVLAANPTNTDRLRLDEEVRSIDEGIREGKLRDLFNVVSQWAVKVDALQGHLLRYTPHIVHFCGHGIETSEIILEDNQGYSHPVSKQALSELFVILKDNIRCVVLNSCYSEDQALAIGEHIDCVIGMSRVIGDKSAITFSKAFYRALSYGRNVEEAFNLARNQIDLSNLEEKDKPKLIALHINPREIIFARAHHKWDPASEQAYYTARDYLINESGILSQDKDEILKHFKILEEEGSKITPHKLRVGISWKYIKRKAPRKVISMLSSVIKDIISRSS